MKDKTVNTHKNSYSGRKRLNFLFISFLAVPFFMAALLSVLSFLGERHWLFDLTAHGRLQYFLFFLLAFGVCIALRKKTGVAISLAFLVAHGMTILPFYWPMAEEKALGDQPSIKILQANLWGRAGRLPCQNLLIQTQEKQPDVLTLEELSPACHQVLIEAGIEQKYPYAQHIEATRISLYSRIPLNASRIQFVHAGNGSSIIAELNLGKRPILLLMAHTTRPINAASDQNQKQHFKEMADIIQHQRLPVIVVGDLNTTPWSVVYRHFMTKTSLVDTQKGRGLQLSWPATYHVPPIHLLPCLFGIDHALVSHDFYVKQRELGQRIGSDHLPLFIELTLDAEAGKG